MNESVQSKIAFPWKPIVLLLRHSRVQVLWWPGRCDGAGAPAVPRNSEIVRVPTAVLRRQSPRASSRMVANMTPTAAVNERARSEVKQGRWVYNPNTGENVWCADCVPTVNITPIPTKPTPLNPPVVNPRPSAGAATGANPLQTTDKTVVSPSQQQSCCPNSRRFRCRTSWSDGSIQCSTGYLAQDRHVSQVYCRQSHVPHADQSWREVCEQIPPSVSPPPIHRSGRRSHSLCDKAFSSRDVEELLADVGRGKQNWKSMRESIPGNVPMGQYNFDDTINPKTRLNESNSDFVMGQNVQFPRTSPVDPSRRPGARIVDLFPQRAHDRVEGVVKMRLGMAGYHQSLV